MSETTRKSYAHHKELQERILCGINKLADNVASTLGPKGRNVMLQEKGRSPFVTKDGVTVARFVSLEDPVENAAAQILKQAANETNSSAGDGTTTSTVLARALVREAQKYLASGASPIELKRGMDAATKEVISNLKKVAIPVEDLDTVEQVATISANGDKTIGKLIAMAVDQAGNDGAILVQDAKSMETSLDVVEGFRFDSGYFATAFVTNERKKVVDYSNPIIMITDYKIELVEEILPALEIAARENRPFVIVAEEIDGQALAALIMNTVRGNMKVAAVKAPRYGEERRSIMQDLAIATGATFISRASGKTLQDVSIKHFGSCDRIEVSKNMTTVMGGKGKVEDTESRIQDIKEQLKQEEDMSACRWLQERITRLASGIAIIKVGGMTEVEMIERKHRIEDALEAVKSAQDQGIVPGGGVALLRSAKFKVNLDNEEQKLGAEIVRKSLYEPIRKMSENAGLSHDVIIEKLSKSSTPTQGWDFSNNKKTDMISAGIIDPAKVTSTALLNAVSVSSTLITTNFAIIET